MTRSTLLIGTDGPSVVVSGRVAYVLAGPLREMVRQAQRRDGWQPQADVMETVAALEQASAAYAAAKTGSANGSALGTDQVPHLANPSESAHVHVSVEVAAVQAGVSPTYVRRLARARRIKGDRVGKAWALDAVAVAEWIEDRRSA